MNAERCACGELLHYSDSAVHHMIEGLIAQLGRYVAVQTPQGCWMVDRHYAALHGVSAAELPGVAARLGFKECSSK